MADKRMFSRKITDSDNFIDMPLSAQALYFHLAMAADDDGIIDCPKKIQRMICATDEDMKKLISNQFIIEFESGLCVIRHWKIHNKVRADRYKPTFHQEEKSCLIISENDSYEIANLQVNSNTQPNDNQVTTECQPMVCIGKDRLGKDRIVTPYIPLEGEEHTNDKTEKVKQSTKAKQVDPELAERFERFYSAYPKKEAKANAVKAFNKLKPDEGLLQTMLTAIEARKSTQEWKKDNGQFIPLPASWLNNRRWEDEIQMNNDEGEEYELLPD